MPIAIALARKNGGTLRSMIALIGEVDMNTPTSQSPANTKKPTALGMTNAIAANGKAMATPIAQIRSCALIAAPSVGWRALARSHIRPPMIVPSAPATTVTEPNQKFAPFRSIEPANRSLRNVGAQYENAPIVAV